MPPERSRPRPLRGSWLAGGWLAGGWLAAGGRVLADWPGLSPDRLFENRDLQPTADLRSIAKGLLRDHLQDPELAAFFGDLFESEARHHSTYVRLAKTFAPPEAVQSRLQELAVEEARIILEGDEVPRMHS